MHNNPFQYRFTTSKNITEVYRHLTEPRNWWMGLFGETITGVSNAINDEFSFRAGDGVHYSNQKLIELARDERIVWEVTESNLSFLQNSGEWTGTRICFDMEEEGNNTTITFTHVGLEPSIECYRSCCSAWSQYLKNLETSLN